MDIQLIQGEFSTAETIDIVAQMVQVRIRFHERAIASNSSEEDIEYRESRIRSLQRELHDLKQQFSLPDQRLTMEARIRLS